MASESDIEAAAERRLLWAISDCEAYCRGVNREIQRDVVELVAKSLSSRLAADRAERERDKSIRESVMDMVDICLSDDADEQERDMAASTILEAVRPSMLAEIANRSDRAEREERARPIDAEWLESIGCKKVALNRWKIQAYIRVNVWLASTGEWRVKIDGGLVLMHNRGQLLDLLRVLKGGAE